jgi:GNAT superfamily N-acetyltransferase
VIIRQLTGDDLAAYRALHRFGIGESPQGFVDVVETDAARPDAEVTAMLVRGDAWGAFDGERLVGKLTVDALPYPSLAHTFWIHAVYVHPDARGSGVSGELMRAAIGAAQAKGASRMALWVNGVNAPAKRLYERIGFRETGRIPGGIRVDGAYVDDVLMTLELSPSAAPGSWTEPPRAPKN